MLKTTQALNEFYAKNDNRTIPEEFEEYYRQENRELLIGVALWFALLGIVYVIVRVS